MDESSLFHYVSCSPLAPNGTGGRGRAGRTGVAKWGERLRWKIKELELMDISSPSKLSLRISETLQAPLQHKEELSALFFCSSLFLAFFFDVQLLHFPRGASRNFGVT